MKSSKKTKIRGLAFITVCLLSSLASAQVIPEAINEIKIPIAKKPTSRPMTIAYVPYVSRYYIADGGLAAPPGDSENLTSPSLVHAYSAKGEYLHSVRPGLDSRSIYYNDSNKQLEIVTYNISTEAGFAPNTGIFSMDMNEQGDLKGSTGDVIGFNPAFGGASSIPTFNPETQQYYSKQGRSNVVYVVEAKKQERVGEIKLELDKAGAKPDDVTDYYVAYTGINGEELALLDVDHKAILVFDLNGKFVGKSMLPQMMKLRSQNHISGLGYANGLFFVYHEPEGEFGTYYGFKISDLAK